MSISAEFIVNLGPYEHVKLTLSGDELTDAMKGGVEAVGESLGDLHASLKAAVLYGQSNAFRAAKDSAAFHDSQDAAETAHEGAVEAVTEGLGATVLSEEEKPVKAPSSLSVEDAVELVMTGEIKPKRPWDKKPAAKKAAPKAAAPKTETKSNWDW